jgi:hypothetical protein
LVRPSTSSRDLRHHGVYWGVVAAKSSVAGTSPIRSSAPAHRPGAAAAPDRLRRRTAPVPVARPRVPQLGPWGRQGHNTRFSRKRGSLPVLVGMHPRFALRGLLKRMKRLESAEIECENCAQGANLIIYTHEMSFFGSEMKRLWYYTHAGTTHGRFSTDDLNEHAARKLLLPSDFVWQDGGSPDAGAPAHTVIDFLAPAPAVSQLPDWLADVDTAVRQDPFEPMPPSSEVPEWLEDLRLWISLETPAASNPAGANATEFLAAAPRSNTCIPDWLSSWKEEEGPTELSAVPKPPMAPPPSVPSGLAKAVIAPSREPKYAVPRTTKSTADTMRDLTGFDADTGQILDAKKFQNWKQQQARTSVANLPSVSNASFLEVFRQARTAVESWVDDDKNRLRVLHADLAEIKNNPDVRAIVHGCANYGNEMHEKLFRHLEFIVENRRKYYAALQARPA